MESSIQNLSIKSIFSSNLKRLMDANKISRKALCQELNIKYTTFCDWVNGKSIPKDSQLELLGSYFSISAGEFFIDYSRPDTEIEKSVGAYYSPLKELDMSLLEKMDDNQIKELLKAGFVFRHKSLEEYIRESGKPFVSSEELDWGEPMGDERW